MQPQLHARGVGAFRGQAVRVRPLAAPVSRRPAVQTNALLGGLFGGGKKEATGGAAAAPYYICIDCGWIYPEAGDAFKKEKGSFKCPACNSPKNRFKVYKGAVKGKPNNTGGAMKTRFGAKEW